MTVSGVIISTIAIHMTLVRTKSGPVLPLMRFDIYVIPYVMICENVSIAAVIDSSPRTGISFFMGEEPFGRAPAHITTAQNAVPRAPLENIPRT